MYSTLIKQVVRHSLTHWLFALINITGLAIGLACCLLIAVFSYHEFSYDRHHEQAENIYLLSPYRETTGGTVIESSSSALAGLAKEDFSEVVEAARYTPYASTYHFGSDKLKADEDNVHFADPGLFTLFDYNWLAGTSDTALQAPNEVVISREFAERYFDSVDVAGEVLLMNEDEPVQVSGVVEPSGNSILEFSVLLPFSYLISKESGGSVNDTYVLLKENANAENLALSFPSFVVQHELELKESNLFPVSSIGLTPVTDIYLAQSSENQEGGISNLARIQIFLIIGLCVLAVAIVNFVNLSISRSSTRALEVGVNLTFGSGRGHLIRRFLLESVMYTAVAMLLAMAIAELSMPLLSAFLRSSLSFAVIPPHLLLLFLLLFMLIVGFLAGWYPALYLSRANPSRVMRGELTKGKSGALFRKTLVIFQFATSIVFSISALTMFSQLSYLRNFDHGFNPDNVAIANIPFASNFNFDSQWSVLERQLMAVAGVEDLTHSMSPPIGGFQMGTSAQMEDGSTVSLGYMSVADNYLQLYELDLIAGRYFHPGLATDEVSTARNAQNIVKGGFILSESAANAMGWTAEEALGKVVRTSQHAATVIGVVEDSVNISSGNLQRDIYSIPESSQYFMSAGAISIKVDESQRERFLAEFYEAWQNYFPGSPMRLTFLDETIRAQFSQVETQMTILRFASVLAVFIACFGLLGLATFNAERRTKEIGIRKAIGGHSWSIVLLLTRDFSKLVFVANLIAWPIAYLLMKYWLNSFASRVDMNPFIFVGGGLITLLIAWIAVGGISLRAAGARPVTSLRYE